MKHVLGVHSLCCGGKELWERPAREERVGFQRKESVQLARLSLRSRSKGSGFLCHLQSKFQVLIKQLASETVRKAEGDDFTCGTS